MEDLDDLFGDQLNDQLQDHLDLPGPAPLPPGLAERVDELRLSGCTDKIAWSRNGSIAYITKDCRSISVASLRFNRSDRAWTQNNYTDPNVTESISKIYKGRQLVHVAWNPNPSQELLVSDAGGRIAILQSLLALNRLTGFAVLSIDPEDSLNALIGLSWLNWKRQTPLGRGAAKVNGQWRYQLLPVEARGPHPVTNKSAFIAVTRGGLVRLGYQGAIPQWHEARHDLDGFSTSGDILTHAAISTDKDDTLLLAVCTYNKQIRLYTLKINWQVTKQGEQVQLNPTIDCQHIAVLDSCTPHHDPAMAYSVPVELSGLHVIPRGLDTNSLPLVLAVFTSLPPQAGTGSGTASTYTILSRWELRDEVPTLDTSFLQLGSKKSGAAELKIEKNLKQLDDVRLEKIVLAVQILHHSTQVAVLSCDGGVEFRSREMTVLPIDETPDRVCDLPQVGFAFNNREPCLHMTLSGNAVVKASFGRDHKVKTTAMQLAPELVDFDCIATLDKTAACLVMAHAVSEATNSGGNTNDDILMAMDQLFQQMTDAQKDTIVRIFLKDICTLFGLHEKILESLSSIDKTIRQHATPRCISLQAALGDCGAKGNRTLPSKVAYTTLSMRNFAISSAMAFGKTPTQPEAEIMKPEVLQYLINLIAWFGNLADYICDQLFDLSRTLNENGSFTLQDVRERVAYLNTPILHFLLSSFTRSLLRHNCRALRSIAPLTQSREAQPGSPLHPLVANLILIFKTNLISPPLFENMLTECDAIISKAYEGLSEAEKQEAELNVFLYGEIPDVLEGAVQSILTTALDKLRANASNSAKLEDNLAFKDYSSLCLLDDARSKRWRQETTFDSLRKIEVSKNTRLRRCTRCDAAMEDIYGPRMSRGGYMFAQMLRACLCGGHFLVDPLPTA